jgi:hypothetical protein
MKPKVMLIILFVCVTQLYPQQNNPEITLEELSEHVYFLASEELEGRKPGTEGGMKAAKYIKDNLKGSGLFPLYENGFQYFDVLASIEYGTNNKLSFNNFEGELSKNFAPLAFSKDTSITAAAIFVGYGFDFEDDSLSWHSYDGIDVTDKWAVVFRGSPDDEGHNSPYTMHSSLRQKTLKARDKGAAGVIFISGNEFDETDELIPITHEKAPTHIGLPVVHVKRNIIDKLLEDYEVTTELLEKQLLETNAPNSFELEVPISISTDVERLQEKTQNVEFMIEGSDPILKDEYIVIGAHYDHLGYGGSGSGSRRPDTNAVHYGADDNASGVASVLEVAEKLYANRSSLKRSVLVYLFGAEEMGLLGSKYLVNNPNIELSKMKHMINLDMVGRLGEDKGLTVGGTGTALGIEDILNRLSEEHSLSIKSSPEGYGPSDHASFYSKDVPVLFFFTGIHEDYHTPADVPEKLNYDGMKSINDMVYDLIVELANLDEALAYQEAGPKTRETSRRRFKVTLGIMPDVSGSGVKGLTADAVMEGRPADLAGMKKGDVIVAMEGKPVNDIYEYMSRLSEFKPGQRISVDVMRDGEKVVLIVDL